MKTANSQITADKDLRHFILQDILNEAFSLVFGYLEFVCAWFLMFLNCSFKYYYIGFTVLD